MTLLCEDKQHTKAHKVILLRSSPFIMVSNSLTMNTKDNSQFVMASLKEFMTLWSLGENIPLNLTTSGGHLNMAFATQLVCNSLFQVIRYIG